jgi:hypothetical protein
MNDGETVAGFASRVGAQFVGSFVAGSVLAVLVLLYLEWRIRLVKREQQGGKR